MSEKYSFSLFCLLFSSQFWLEFWSPVRVWLLSLITFGSAVFQFSVSLVVSCFGARSGQQFSTQIIREPHIRISWCRVRIHLYFWFQVDIKILCFPEIPFVQFLEFEPCLYFFVGLCVPSSLRVDLCFISLWFRLSGQL